MITVTGRDTCKPAYIDENYIQSIEELTEDIDGRPYPWSRVYVKHGIFKHKYFLDVVESKRRIEELIEIEKAKPPRKNNEQSEGLPGEERTWDNE